MTIRHRVRRCERCGNEWKERAGRPIWENPGLFGSRIIGVTLLPLGPSRCSCRERWKERMVMRKDGTFRLEFYV